MTGPVEPPRVEAAGARSIVVVGAGAANLKSTVAANLVAALAALDVPVALRDHDGASTRALAPHRADAASVTLPWAGRAITLATGADALVGVRALVVDPPPRLSDVTRAAIAGAALVLVPVDASPLARRILRDVAALVAGSEAPGRLRVALSRLVPRDVDRWGLVDEIERCAPGALLHATLPMARARHGAARAPSAAAGPADVPLYAPRTAAARAYGRLARELLDALHVDSPGAALSTTA